MSRENQGRELSAEEWGAVLSYRRDGCSVRQTAALCNLNKDTIRLRAPADLIAAIRKMRPPSEKSAEAG